MADPASRSRSAPITASPASFSTDGRATMTIMTGQTARAIAIVGLAALLAGCKAHQSVTSTMPADYRQRHPIAVKEGTRTVELFIGDRRGSLDPTQQAEVASFAHTWRREATGGIIIDVPAGTPNERAAADALREVRSILAVSGVPGE